MLDNENKDGKRGVGRPTDKTAELTEEICDLIASGMSIRSICKLDRMPAYTTISKWRSKDEEFEKRYTRAIEDRAEAFAEEIVAIADEPVENSHDAQRQRTRVDARKWIACKLKPRRYGDKVELAGPEGKPLPILQLTFAIPGQAIETVEPETIDYKPDK